MNSPDNRQNRIAWIPWIFALVALFGVNALVPDDSRSRRSETSDEIGISQLADDARTPGRTFNPLFVITPDSSSEFSFLNSSSLILRVADTREVPFAQPQGGAVQGRAPPTNWIS